MRHRDGILAWFDSRIANGLIEGINSLVQAAKAKARGYRSTRTLKAITYLIAGSSTSDYPREIAGSQFLIQLLYVSHASTSTEPARNRRDRQKGEGSLLHGHESR
jgi:hypothetical protein